MNSKLKRNKIFMFSSVHVWMDTRVFYKEAMSLARNGYEIDLYAIDNGAPVPESLIHVHLIPKKSRWNRPFLWFQLYKEALKSDALYYHFHDPELLLVAEKIREKKPNAVIIYDMHEHFPSQIITKDWIPKLVRKPLSKLISKKEKKAIQTCDAIIFAEKSYSYNYPEYKGVKQEILNYPTWQHCYEVSKEEKFTFIYVGDIVIERNIFGMLDFISELKNRNYSDTQLKLIGPIAMPLKVKVNNYIKKLGIEDEVKIYGRLPYEEIWNHYRTAHIGLCILHPQPNFLHSLATKLFEYMAVGLPSIASDFPDWRVLINETNSGITVNPHNICEIADAAELLMNNTKYYRLLSKSGRIAFEHNYNWSTEAQKLKKLYRGFSKG